MKNKFVQNGLGGFGIFPPVIKALIISNVVIFLFDAFFLGIYHINGTPLSYFFAKYFY
ncbi:MAG: hypothetical protein ACK42Z_05095 [Candidatus Kapaibacteriota bacterium]